MASPIPVVEHIGNCIYNLYVRRGIIERRVQSRVLGLARSFPVVTVTGPRQSGKTTLCRTAFPELAAAQTANLVNLTAFGGGVGVSHNTAKSWLSVLEASYIVTRLPPLHRNLRKRVVKAKKLHFVDSGLACWLLGIRAPEELRRHPLRGALFESWVVAEVSKALAISSSRIRLHYWRDHRGREVDLVVDRGHDLVAVEVKSGATVHSSFFESLDYFTALAREAVPRPTEPTSRVLVYGGSRRQERSTCHVLQWREVQGYDWTMTTADGET